MSLDYGTKKKLSKEQLKAKAREYHQKRREKINNDPVLKAIEAEKERKKYETKKKKKQVKPVKDMNDRELRKNRKIWRTKAKKAYQKKKQLDRCTTQDTPPDSDSQTSPQIVLSRKRSGKKKIRRDRAKVVRDNKKLMKKNTALTQQANKWRKRCWRMSNSTSNKNSPGKLVTELIKNGNKQEIRRKLLFGEEIKCQLTQHFKQLSSRRKKRTFGELLVGNNNFLKKYKLLCDLRGTISTKVFNSTRMLTNNKQLRTRMNKINEIVKQDIRTFFEDDEVSMLCPGKKDCITKYKIKKQKRVLTDTLKNHQVKFLGKVDYKISYVSFWKLKPFWVVQHKVSERDTCLCKVHAKIQFLVLALFKKNIIDNSNIKEFARLVCCHIDNVACLQRMCGNCMELQIPYNLLEADTTVTYFYAIYLGGCLKRTADRVVAQGGDIDCFESFVKVLKENVRKVEIILVYEHEIQSMKSIIPSDIPSFKGTFKVHPVVFMKEFPNKLVMRKLSCFDCYDCDKFSLGYHNIILQTNETEDCLENVPVEVEYDAHTQPTSSTSGQQSKDTSYAPGTYLLVKFEKHSKRSKDVLGFRYVCCVEKQDEDKSITVNGLKKLGNSSTEFIVTDNDNCVISIDQVLQVLPNPNLLLKKRKVVYLFPFKVNVKEL